MSFQEISLTFVLAAALVGALLAVDCTARYASHFKEFDTADEEFAAFRCNGRRHPLILAATIFAPTLAISLARE